MNAILPSPRPDRNPGWPPKGGLVIDRRGNPVDVTGPSWKLLEPTKAVELHWHTLAIPEGPMLDFVKSYFAWLITSLQPTTVKNAFQYIRPFTRAPSFSQAASNGTAVRYLAFSEAKDALLPHEHYQLHYARQFYRWAVKQSHPQFLSEVSARLDEVVIGGNRKGHAVRSRDPDHGPLDAFEIANLTAALRVARAEKTMPLVEQAAVWLVLSTGSNAGQYACLREDDFVQEVVNGQVVASILKVPRHKKGHVHHRTEFRERKLQRFVGEILADLIDQNRREAPIDTTSAAARPLFRASSARSLPETEWSWHLTTAGFTQLIGRAVKRLRVRSRTGGPLRIATRRFRYSLVRRLIEAGASAYAVADALDHSDLQNVSTYMEIFSDIVEHLDAGMALALAPRAQAFAKIVRSEQEAERGDVKGSRRYHGDREKEIFEPIGTCGSHSFCGVNAPLACYTCHRFQAWMDAPHDLVLNSLLEARDRRRSQGLSAKMVAIEDELIAAVANVIVRIADMRQADALNG
jgi:hypothetical protein